MNLIYFLHLFNYQYAGIAFSDAFLGLLLLYGCFRIRLTELPLKLYDLTAVLFLVYVGISGMVNLYASYFSAGQFSMTYAKLILYVTAFIVLPKLLKSRIDRLDRIMVRSIVVICALGLYQFVAHYFLKGLPYSLSHPLISDRSGYESMFTYGGQFRIRSTYTEPAHFAIYVNILYAYVLFNRIKTLWAVHGLVGLSVLLSFSFSGILLLMICYFLSFLSTFKREDVRKVVVYSVLFAVVLVFFVNNPYLQSRLEGVSDSRDGSGMTRLLGSWELALKAPLMGAGLGNNKSFYETLDRGEFKVYSEVGEVYNILAVILLTTGAIGLALFLLFYFTLVRFNWLWGLFILFTCAGWGYFNAAPFWFALILFSTVAQAKHDAVSRDIRIPARAFEQRVTWSGGRIG